MELPKANTQKNSAEFEIEIKPTNKDARNVLPTSPINNLEGCQLRNKKLSIDPINIHNIGKSFKAIKENTIIITPPTSPSIPSIKLIKLIIAVINTIRNKYKKIITNELIKKIFENSKFKFNCE